MNDLAKLLCISPCSHDIGDIVAVSTVLGPALGTIKDRIIGANVLLLRFTLCIIPEPVGPLSALKSVVFGKTVLILEENISVRRHKLY